jgi:hypothetical protein
VSNYGVRGSSVNSYGVSGYSTNSIAVAGYSDGTYGVFGSSTTNTGVEGRSTSGNGVHGESSGHGVDGFSAGDSGVYGSTTTGVGVRGISTSNGTGVYGQSNTGIGVWGYSSSSYAGKFSGDVYVTGHITAVGGCCAAGVLTTRIDDPLDPANKYLDQSAVQSPDMSTVINGNATLDGKGEATVGVPAWFVAANGDFRYQLTAVGASGPNLYIAQKLAANSFKIGGGSPGGEVSWQVTGIRQDAYAKAHRVGVEVYKPASEQGK